MRKVYKAQSLMAEINITPFTDVILVLLIIFMITTPLIIQNGITIKLPQASSKDIFDNPKTVYITITSEGVVYIENKVLSSKELKAKLDRIITKDPDIKVDVAADQACRFQDVVKVIDILKESGIKSLNIATRLIDK